MILSPALGVLSVLAVPHSQSLTPLADNRIIVLHYS